MASTTMTVTLRFRWWFRPYVLTLAALSMLLDREPDWDRVGKVLKHAVKVCRAD